LGGKEKVRWSTSFSKIEDHNVCVSSTSEKRKKTQKEEEKEKREGEVELPKLKKRQTMQINFWDCIHVIGSGEKNHINRSKKSKKKGGLANQTSKTGSIASSREKKGEWGNLSGKRKGH